MSSKAICIIFFQRKNHSLLSTNQFKVLEQLLLYKIFIMFCPCSALTHEAKLKITKTMLDLHLTPKLLGGPSHFLRE